MEKFSGKSMSWLTVKEYIEDFASHDFPVFITGNTGVGKGVVAEMIHAASPRRGGPFIAINCAAIPESLVESELFGVVHGAFTGTAGSHDGIFIQADHGTLFLDELAEVSPEIQAKLLRVVEEKKVRRLGSKLEHRVDVRIIAATNQSVETAIAEKKLRPDLWYRLGVTNIHIPDLSQRQEDIIPLFKYFWQGRFKEEVQIPSDAEELLELYSWPGNLRELESVVIRARISKMRVDSFREHLLRVYPKLSSVSYKDHLSRALPKDDVAMISLREAEDRHILRVLEKCDGNKTKATQVLGISKKGLSNRLKAIGYGRKALSQTA